MTSGGLSFPRLSAAAGWVWIAGRVVYALGMKKIKKLWENNSEILYWQGSLCTGFENNYETIIPKHLLVWLSQATALDFLKRGWMVLLATSDFSLSWEPRSTLQSSTFELGADSTEFTCSLVLSLHKILTPVFIIISLIRVTYVAFSEMFMQTQSTSVPSCPRCQEHSAPSSPSLMCSLCSSNIHLECLSPKTVPALKGDTFFSLNCNQCSSSETDEVGSWNSILLYISHVRSDDQVTRNRISWLGATLLSLYHLHITNTSSNLGFYHWRNDIALLIATHWSSIFGHAVKKKKTWQVCSLFCSFI